MPWAVHAYHPERASNDGGSLDGTPLRLVVAVAVSVAQHLTGSSTAHAEHAVIFHHGIAGEDVDLAYGASAVRVVRDVAVAGVFRGSSLRDVR